MEKFIELCEQFSFTQFVTLIVLLTLGIKGASDVIKGIKTYLNDWYSKKRGVEKKDETIEKRVTKLEESDKAQIERLDTISAGVQQIAASVETLIENTDKNIIATMRPEIMRLWNEAKIQGYMTQSQYETYAALADIYVAKNGNGLFRHAILPEMDKMEIRKD